MSRKAKEQRELVNQTSAAAIANVTVSAFRRWPIEAVERRGRCAMYDAAAVRELARERRGGAADLAGALTRLLDAKAARAEIAAERLAAELVPVADVRAHYARLRGLVAGGHRRGVRRLARAAAGATSPGDVELAVRDVLYRQMDKIAAAIGKGARP